MLTQLRLQGFKSWRDTGEMRFAPLTGLFGTNSSGKSSILQFLRVLKATVETNDINSVIHLRGDLFQSEGESVLFSDITYAKQGDLRYEVSWVFDQVLEVDDWWKKKNDIAKIDAMSFRSHITNDNDNRFILESFAYSFAQNAMLHSSGIRKHPLATLQEMSYVMFFDTFDTSTQFGHGRKGYEFPLSGNVIANNVVVTHPEFAFEYEKLFRKMIYVGPLRDYPHRIYTRNNGNPVGVGVRGEWSVNVLLNSEESEQWKVAEWLKELGLVYDFSLHQIVEGREFYEVRVRQTENSAEVLLPDVGFGVSQILPVITLCFSAPEKSILIFEQPEIHLHPSVQAGLADVFIDAIKTRNVQIIVESHSEHFLRRLQRRIAEEQFDEEDAALYFTSIEDGESKLTPLELDTYGNINNWPDNFFGDDMGDLSAMVKAGIKRQIKERENGDSIAQ